MTEKLGRLGLSQALSERILEDLYAKGTGLLWSYSKEEFDSRVQVLTGDWHRLESPEHNDPEFVDSTAASLYQRHPQLMAGREDGMCHFSPTGAVQKG